MSGRHTNCIKYRNYAGKSVTTLILEILWMGNYSRSQLASILSVNVVTVKKWLACGKTIFRPSSTMIPKIIAIHKQEFENLVKETTGYYNGIKVLPNSTTEHRTL